MQNNLRMQNKKGDIGMAKTEYGLQMYSVRDITDKSLKEALKEVAKMGYKYVEFAGFFGNSAEDVKSWLDEYGLVCSGTHTGIPEITPETIDKTIAYHKVIGCDMLIVPGCDWTTPEKAQEAIDSLNYANKKLAENGITLGYHNHSREFFPTPTANDIVFEDEIIEKTDVALEIDTFWLYNAGKDVIPYLEEHKDRIKLVHLKDGVASPEENKNFDHGHDDVVGLSVGSGKAPVDAVREWAIKNNIRMVIESEGLDPTGLEEVKRCIDYLRTLD